MEPVKSHVGEQEREDIGPDAVPRELEELEAVKAPLVDAVLDGSTESA